MNEEQLLKNKRFYIPRDILIIFILFSLLSVFRILFFKSDYFLFLFWNLFLAVIPFVISIVFANYTKNKKVNVLLFLVVGIVWVLLLPNAPYVVTDLIHLGKFHGAPIIFDSFLLFSFAWLGMLIFMHSLYHIEETIKDNYGTLITYIKIPSIILLTSIGVYMGRYMRFNSWDVFINPSFLEDTFNRFTHPIHFGEAITFVLSFFVFLLLSYIAWKKK